MKNKRNIILAAALFLFCADCAGNYSSNGSVFSAEPAVIPLWTEPLYSLEMFSYRNKDYGKVTILPSQNILFAGTSGGKAVCMSMDGGKMLWKFNVKGEIRTKPVVKDDSVLFGTSNGCVHKIQIRTGNSMWKEPFCTDSAIKSDFAHDRKQIYFATNTNTVYSIGLDDGRFIWKYKRNNPRTFTIEENASPVLSGEYLIAGFSDGFLVSMKKDLGTVVWETSLSLHGNEFTDIDTTPVVSGGNIYAACTSEGIFAVSEKDGKILWMHDAEGASSPVISGSDLVFSTTENEVRKISTADGHLIWKREYAAKNLTEPFLLKDMLVFGHDKGIVLIDAADGNLIRDLMLFDGISSIPSMSDGILYFISNTGCLNAVRISV